MEKLIIGSVEGSKIIDNHLTMGYGFVVEGSLIDSAFLYDVEYNGKGYKYMALIEKYATPNSSKYLMITSNDYSDVIEYEDRLMQELDIQDIIDEIYYDNTLTYLEEVGLIPLEQVEYDIDNFIEALERITGKEYKVYNDIKGQYIAIYNN